jgi:hypothetical protein
VITVAPPVRPPRIVVALAAGTFSGLAAWAIGVHWSQSTLVGVIVVAFIGAYHLLPRSREATLDPVPYERGTRARRNVSRLSWVLTGSDGYVSGSGLIPLLALAEQRLELRGMSLAHPDGRVAAILGSEVHALLSDPPDELRLTDFARCVDALDRLADVPLAPNAHLLDAEVIP